MVDLRWKEACYLDVANNSGLKPDASSVILNLIINSLVGKIVLHLISCFVSNKCNNKQILNLGKVTKS